MLPPPNAVLLLAAGVDPDELRLTAELLGHFHVPYFEMTVQAGGGAPAKELMRQAVAGARAVVIASADQETPAEWARAGIPVIRVPVPVGEAIGDPLSLLVPKGGAAAGEGFATVAIGNAGARNAALFVVAMLAAQGDENLGLAWADYRRAQTEKVLGQILAQ